MPKPKKYNLDGISPMRGHEYFEKKKANEVIDAYDAYLEELGIELPEEVVEKDPPIISDEEEEMIYGMEEGEDLKNVGEEEVDLEIKEEE